MLSGIIKKSILITVPRSSYRTLATTTTTATKRSQIDIDSYLSARFNETVTPESVAQESIDNIEKYNTYLNAFIDTVDPSTVKTQASEATLRWRKNFRAPFTATAIEHLQNAGVIMAGKVNMDEFGMGSYNIFSNVGPVKNPHGVVGKQIKNLDENDARAAGGSSGGSAAAVASNMCFAALGSDTGGSVRLPASYCGIVGFKPSYGRISRWGLIAYASSLDTVGILSKTVDDAKLLYEIMSKEDSKDSTCLTKVQRERITQFIPELTANYSTDKDRPLQGIRIGIPQEFNVAELSSASRTLWRRGIRALKDAGATVVPVSLPNIKLAVGAYVTLGTAEASSNLQRYDGVRYGHQSDKVDGKDELYSHTRSEGFGKEVRRRILTGTYVLTSGSFDNYFLRAQKIRQTIRNDFDRVFCRPNIITMPLNNSSSTTSSSSSTSSSDKHNNKNNVDNGDSTRVHALLTPTAATTAPKLVDCIGDHVDPINAFMDDIMTIPASLAGLPAMSVPFGTCAEDGFPVGLQVMAQYGDEASVFRVARVLEEQGKKLS
ncbi:Trimeric GatFAB AmidoTransferase(AdT) complex subunit [Podila epigama]|nr:Trimeric GatFAB AmidoTransferase(AdT) complex subunit [Podila epigama]